MRHPNLDLLDNLLVMPDGSLSSTSIEYVEKIPWGTAGCLNARWGRIKLCPFCFTKQPIANFIVENPVARTVIRRAIGGIEEFAYVCADVREWCDACQKRGEEALAERTELCLTTLP